MLSQDSAGEDRPIVLARQGSFFVGGRQVQAPGRYDPAGSPASGDAGETFWIDQMYVQYQVPAHARRHPVVLVHGGCGTGRVWETTPDGREGYQNLLLREGYPVYIVDFPHRGRSGFPSFNGPFGTLGGAPLTPAETSLAGLQYAWIRWRLGPRYPEAFPVQQFPMQAVDAFMQHLVPCVADDPALISDALAQLCTRIGPAILVTHSQSGLFGWLAAAATPMVRAVVSYEPGFVFPEDELPAPIPLYTGKLPAGTPIAPAQFDALAAVPVQVVYGDNIPAHPVPELPADGRRAQVLASTQFVQTLNRHGGRAEVLHLPDAGLRGNSHFMFSDLNNIEVARQLLRFLQRHGLDE